MSNKSFDVICFGDEVPGVLALVAAGREYSRRNKGEKLRVLLMSPGDAGWRLGGHLTRGELSYLDRSQVPGPVREKEGLPTFGDPPAIYAELLRNSSPRGENIDKKIALDPNNAAAALKSMLAEATDYAVLSHVRIDLVLKQGNRIVGVRTSKDEVYQGSQFIDCTVNAELSTCAGVAKRTGFGTLGVPDTELPVTLVFETEGLSAQQLKDREAHFLKRFRDSGDKESQKWIEIAAGGRDSRRVNSLKDRLGVKPDAADKDKNSLFFPNNGDHIDFRSPAISIAYHAFRGTEFDPDSMAGNGSRLDQANIAILDGRGASGDKLSWNALLFRVSATEADELAKTGAKPTKAMLEEFEKVKTFFIKTLGAKSVRHASELYIRHAGNVAAEAVAKPLSGSDMLRNGLSSSEALGTFGYHFDVRGGIEGLGAAIEHLSISLKFAQPLFNYGIDHTKLKAFRNTAVVSPASGFTGLAASAGRIVEFNVGVGQGVGIAIATALSKGQDLFDVSNREIHQVLEATGKLPKLFGDSTDIGDMAKLESGVRPSSSISSPYLVAAANTTVAGNTGMV